MSYRNALLVIVAMGLPTTMVIARPHTAYAEEIRVIDGDTLKIGKITHRLHGIDAPEEGQKCNASGSATWKCGAAATDALQQLLASDPVSCQSNSSDGYGRELSVCWAGEIELNDRMVRSGFAWAFRKYSGDYIVAEESARAVGKGIWQAPTQTPWDYRAEKWAVAEQQAPDGCPIKGNISRNGRIYHAPWSPWYSRTKINTGKGERWFCDEAEAIAAGWRAPIWR